MNYKILKNYNNIERICYVQLELYKNDALVQFDVILIYFHLITNNLI